MLKLQREKETVHYMIELFCRKKHGTKTMCEECRQLSLYALTRLQKCPYGEEKPACKDCSVHCYQSQMRERIREVMRFSGPRMVLYFPLDYIRHKFRE